MSVSQRSLAICTGISCDHESGDRTALEFGDGGSVDVRTPCAKYVDGVVRLGTTIGEAAMLTDDTSYTVAVGEINPANY